MPAISKQIENFYKSKVWKQVRKLKIMKERGLCERCHRQGKEVHHKIYLTNENIEDPNITIDFNNLELLCHDCHNQEHNRSGMQIRKDISFNSNGDMTPPIKTRNNR